ncbi:DinI-like family protein [Escherichia coli]|uniref:DinI-like family protein n=1 Tax=Escherichia coli TaxID=562 RepID=A0AAJ2Y881_ECOLX|nr:DinI-like family protein [Escherichia coli]
MTLFIHTVKNNTVYKHSIEETLKDTWESADEWFVH